MTRAKRIRVQRYDWFDKVAMWRACDPQHRQALGQGDTRYYFTLPRFVHKITVETLCQMEYAPRPDAT